MLTSDQTFGTPLGRRWMPMLGARAYFAYHAYRGTVCPRWADWYSAHDRALDVRYATLKVFGARSWEAGR